MIPILYESTETKFASNGLGRLGDASSCSVKEARNGEYYLTMNYPITGRHYKDIQLGRLILAVPEPGKESEPFEIKNISRPINGLITITANHISYRLSSIPVMPFTASTCSDALSGLVKNSAELNPFKVWTDKNVTANYILDKPQSFRACLGGTEGSLLDTFGTAEYEFNRFTVKMHLHRGTNKGVCIRYGKNLTDVTQEESIENTVTGICPYWSGSVDNVNVVVTLPEKVLESDSADKFAYKHTAVVDLTQDINLPEGVNKPTEETLRKAAESYMQKHEFGVPDVNLTVSYQDLADTVEYAGKTKEQINLCDTVTVIFEKLGIEATAKVISVEWDVLGERYTSIELGSYKTAITDTIYQNHQDEVAQRKIASMKISDALQEAKDNANKQIKDLKNLEGYAFVHYNEQGRPYEFIVADSDNLNKAVNVWRWNQGGLAHSSTGYNGEYSNVAITQDGAIVADFITAGILNAGVIRAGILQDVKGNMIWNLEDGSLTIKGVDDDIDDLKKNDSNQNIIINDLSDSVDSLKQKNESFTNSLNKLEQSLNQRYTAQNDRLTALDNQYRQELLETEKALEKFGMVLKADSDGVHIQSGNPNDSIETRMQNGVIAFIEKGRPMSEAIAWFEKNQLYVSQGVFNGSLMIKPYAFIQRDDGSLDFKRI